MGVFGTLRDAIGSKSAPEKEETPSHRCETCGEEYFTTPGTEITTCRSCGGVRVERVE
ncbi:MAG: hypothetical protein ABEJ40_04950 [Haloarculaceae archaeon]